MIRIIEYRFIYKENEKKTKIMINYQVAEAEGFRIVFARLILNKDLFTGVYKIAEINHVCGVCVIALL